MLFEEGKSSLLLFVFLPPDDDDDDDDDFDVDGNPDAEETEEEEAASFAATPPMPEEDDKEEEGACGFPVIISDRLPAPPLFRFIFFFASLFSIYAFVSLVVSARLSLCRIQTCVVVSCGQYRVSCRFFHNHLNLSARTYNKISPHHFITRAQE